MMSEPQDEKERYQWLLDKIFEIRKKELVQLDALLDRMQELDKFIVEAREKLEKATSKLEITKYIAIIKSYKDQKQICSERRYLIKYLHQDEARLEKELMKLRIK